MPRVGCCFACVLSLLVLTGCGWTKVEFRQSGGESPASQLHVDLSENTARLVREDREIDQKLLVKEFTQLKSATREAGNFAGKTYGAESTGGAWYEIKLIGGPRVREWKVYAAERPYWGEEPAEIRALRDRLQQIQSRLERWIESPEGRAEVSQSR